ncbi:MAG: TRAP transporter TatT component family protein [Myxococcota bacterium]
MKRRKKPSAWLVGFILIGTACTPARKPAWEAQATSDVKPSVSPQQITDLRTQADAAWEQRAEKQQLLTTINLWEQILAADPEDGQLLTRLSRAYYFLGDGFYSAENAQEAALGAYEKGIAAGERALMAISPEFTKHIQAGDKVDDSVKFIQAEGQAGLYWYAVNLGRFAVTKGFTTTLFYKDRIHAVMQRVLDIDETFFHAAPHRYFGVFFAKAPAFAGGDMEKSKLHFDEALALDSRYFATKVLYAEFYAAKIENKELFTRLLNEVKNADPSVLPDLIPEQRVEQDKAKKLLSQIREIF